MRKPRRDFATVVEELFDGIGSRQVVSAVLIFARSDGEQVIGYTSLDNDSSHTASLVGPLRRALERAQHEHAAREARARLLN